MVMLMRNQRKVKLDIDKSIEAGELEKQDLEERNANTIQSR